MNWRAKTHPFETVVTTAAPLLFAVACGWSAWIVLASVVAGAIVLVAAAAIGLFVIGLGARNDEQPGGGAIGDELLLDDVLQPGTLWLDDPLVVPPQESRVVRLFAAEPATPGELVERIGDYLGDRSNAASLAGPPLQPVPDASAELYAALANIRTSLR